MARKKAKKKAKKRAPARSRKKVAASRKKKKTASWKSPATRKKVHKEAARIKRAIGKNVKGSKAARERVFHGIAYGQITGRKPLGGTRRVRGKGKRKGKGGAGNIA